MFFADRLTLDAPRRTRDGYMVTRAKAARAGIYDYLGSELDPQGTRFEANDIVKVWRPEAEVFARDSVASFLMKPITNDHPSEPVTADSWRTYAKGVVGQALREGDFLAFDLVLMDADLIRSVESGKRELSNGYSSDISFEDGKTPDGDAYQAVQRNIRGNHVAVVKKGRAGPFCRISDAAICDSAAIDLISGWLGDERTYNPGSGSDKNDRADGGSAVATKTITFDGMPIEATDASEAAIRKLEGQVKALNDAKAESDTKVATLTTDKATLEAKVTTLEQQVADAKLSPEKLRDAAKSYGAVVDKAKALGVAVTDSMDEPAIMKAVVDAKIGDAAKDWNDIQVAASFATLTKDAKPGAGQADPVRQVLADGAVKIGDTATIRDAARSSRYAAK